MYRRIKRYYKPFAILLIAGLVDISWGNFSALPSWGSEKDSISPLISIEANNLPLKEFFGEISNQTGYQILYDFDEQSKNVKITVKWENQSMFQGVREIIKKTGIKSFVIVSDNESRTLRVSSFGRGPSPQTAPTIRDDTGLMQKDLMALHKRQKQEIENMKNNPDEIVIAPEDGHPGVTRRQLQALHERQKKEFALSNNDPDAIAIAASEDHPVVTNRQLQDLHEGQKNTIKNMESNLDEIVIPPEDGHPGVTRGELQTLHERQKRELALDADDPDAIAIPASENHPALTNHQLQELHKQQKNWLNMELND
jgi:hypothetical protein